MVRIVQSLFLLQMKQQRLRPSSGSESSSKVAIFRVQIMMLIEKWNSLPVCSVITENKLFSIMNKKNNFIVVRLSERWGLGSAMTICIPWSSLLTTLHFLSFQCKNNQPLTISQLLSSRLSIIHALHHPILGTRYSYSICGKTRGGQQCIFD